MQDSGHTKSAKKPELIEHVLREFEEQSETSTRTVSAVANVSFIMVWRALGTEDLRPYCVQWVHALNTTDDQPRVDFLRWFLQRLAVQPDFAAHVLFIDECSFSREDIFNAHNWRRMDGGTYLVFLQEGLPVLLQSVPANIKARMWFQHDGAPGHFSADVRSTMGTVYPGRWIGRSGPINWPARLPYLSYLDFFLWDHMKSLVYASPVDSDEALVVVRIAVIAGDIWGMPRVFANVRQSLRRWCEACILAGGCSFEQFL
ncbi:uncharacterized protein TNCV_120791 [Trichonephila clavipes]|nr:uncharacterized protein TNCV_120791 [Trichonephila clavipes]